MDVGGFEKKLGPVGEIGGKVGVGALRCGAGEVGQLVDAVTGQGTDGDGCSVDGMGDTGVDALSHGLMVLRAGGGKVGEAVSAMGDGAVLGPGNWQAVPRRRWGWWQRVSWRGAGGVRAARTRVRCQGRERGRGATRGSWRRVNGAVRRC